MYHIQDYRQRAVEKIVPYLIEFPDVVSIVENSADRYQAIEDVLWRIADNFKVADSRGVFLTAHANNEVVNINYTDKAEDAFTYGTDLPLYQAYGTGHYYSQASYISGIRKTLTEDKTIRAVLSQIIQNNTNCTIEDLIEALKLLYNSENVRILESNPLRVNVELIGSAIELSSSGNYENIKKMLPACVYLGSLYIDPKTFDIFRYDTKSAYGISRYPVRVGDTTDIYQYISNAITLNSTDNEYIKRDISISEPDRSTFDSSKIITELHGGTAFTSTIGTVDGGTATYVTTDSVYGGNSTTPSVVVSSDGILTRGMTQCLLGRNFYYNIGDSWEFTTRLKMKNYLGNNNTSVFGTQFFGSSFVALYTHPSYSYCYFYARKDNGTLIKDFTATTALYAGRTYYVTYGWDKNSKRLYIRRSEDGVNWAEESIIVSASDLSNIKFIFRPTIEVTKDVEWIDLKQTTFSINNVEVFNCNKDRINYFSNNMYCYVTGSIVSSTNGDTFVSCNDIENVEGFTFGISSGELALTYNGTVHLTGITAEANKDYSFMIAIVDGDLKVWSVQSVRIAGQSINNDISYLNNVIFNKPALITVTGVEEIQADIYFNCENTSNGPDNFGNFTYYAIIMGNIDLDSRTCGCTEYYITSFGEKHILFNCLENVDNLKISTNSTRSSNLITHQSIFNYKYNHSCGRYVYLDGSSYIQYNTMDNAVTGTIDGFDISFDIAHPVSINNGVILSNMLGTGSEIGIDQDNEIYIKYNYLDSGVLTENTIVFYDEDILLYGLHNYQFLFDGDNISLYKDGTLVKAEDLEGDTPVNLTTTLYVGSDNSGTNALECILRNINIGLTYTEGGVQDTYTLSIPFTETLKDTTKEIGYTNYGARFISVPQLISNQAGTDLYNNKVIRYN